MNYYFKIHTSHKKRRPLKFNGALILITFSDGAPLGLTVPYITTEKCEKKKVVPSVICRHHSRRGVTLNRVLSLVCLLLEFECVNRVTAPFHKFHKATTPAAGCIPGRASLKYTTEQESKKMMIPSSITTHPAIKKKTFTTWFFFYT